MLSRFYQRNSGLLLIAVLASLPFFMIQAKSLPVNNDIETWLPNGSDVRAEYEQFKRDFGVEEVILVAVDQSRVTPELTEALCTRIERLPGIRQCWSPRRMQAAMAELGVSEEEFLARARGLSLSLDSRWHGLIALLSDVGLKDRFGTVRDVQGELAYCQLDASHVCLSGSPVVACELNRLGGRGESEKFFLITLVLCLGVLYYWLRDWKLSIAIMVLTVWAIQVTLTIFKWMGGEMNFILGALGVMVTVFTIEACIHVLHYHNASLDEPDPLGSAWRKSIRPCSMSMLTTTIGLYSVSVSDIVPVMQFGTAAALGAVVSMLTGLLLTPALIVCTRHQLDVVDETPDDHQLAKLARSIITYHRPIIAVAAGLTVVGLTGLWQIKSRIDPLDFLPRSSPVLADLRRIERELTNVDSIEAVVDFGSTDSPFVDRLAEVRKLEATLRKNPAGRHTMSLACFFPEELPTDGWKLMQLLQKAESKRGQSEFISADQKLWRISARVAVPPGRTSYDILEEFQASTPEARLGVAVAGVRYTGIAPLLQQAQQEIFNGFWQSFLSALAVILIVMAGSLRSIPLALLAIIPNLVPICIVFGLLGWAGFAVDIGMMMTGSIALGITVDGTFHFLSRYEELLKTSHKPVVAVRGALLATGGPIFESIVVSSLGMLALSLSSFTPTVRFGLMMATLLLTALAGGLVLLPALLCWNASRVERRKISSDLPARTPYWRTKRAKASQVA